MTVQKNKLKNLIPITSTFFDIKTVLGKYILCKSGTSFELTTGNSKNIFGFGCSKSKALAKSKSISELLERTLANSFINSQKRFNKYDVRTMKQLKGYSLSNAVLISPDNAMSSSGLSYHKNLSSALRHGTLEILERHFNSLIWYSEVFKLQKIDELIDDFGFTITTYTIETEIDIPYFLTTIKNLNRKIFIAGTSLKLNSNKSKEHSIVEAYMLLDNVLNKNFPSINSQTTFKRMESLKGNLSSKRNSLLSTKISPNKKNKLRNYQSLEIFLNTDYFKRMNFTYNKICETEANCLIRVSSTEVLSLEYCRNQFSNIIPDPFC